MLIVLWFPNAAGFFVIRQGFIYFVKGYGKKRTHM